MTSTAYTAHDTPQVVERIDQDLATIRSTVKAADPALRSLVLTGGFARGEGTVLNGQPQNDYDLVAIRGPGRPKVPYHRLRAGLEARLGLHVDLAPVAAWRLRWVARSIFWYETALRGRTLWGTDLLDRIPVRTPDALDAAEGLRLLANRAAGLLLATGVEEDHPRHIQAAKALLAAADAHLLAAGTFAPSQTERWTQLRALRSAGGSAPRLRRHDSWLDWAYAFKRDPGSAPARDSHATWSAAARAVLDSVPTALEAAGVASLEAYAHRDRILDHVVYYARARKIPDARTLVLHPTGRVRVGTLRLLEASLDGRVRPAEALRCLRPVARRADAPLPLLEALRHATLQ